MAVDTTTVLGEAESKFCLDHATFMIHDNYGRNPSDMQPESRQAMQDVDRLWNKVTTGAIGVEKPSGFYATLYTPKDGNDCPPTLALRGTVFHDARGIAIALRIKAYPAFAPDRSEEFAFGFAPGYEAPGVPVTELTWRDRVGWVETLTSQGRWLELFSHQSLNTRVQRRLTVVPPAIARLIPADYRDIVIEATLELWLNRDQGDWATNVIQGIGAETAQYGDELKAAVTDAVLEAQNFDNKLRITGHSLGGGMASAAALHAKAISPETTVWGLGYDSAGVHPNTAARLESSNSRAFEARITTRAVEDEVLTSMEKRSDFVPLASSAIRYTGSSMPPPIGTYVERKGVSPGAFGGTTFAPKWGEMPNLLRIEDQTLISGASALNTWADLARHFAAGRNFSEALGNLNTEIGRRVDERNRRREAAEAAEERAEARRELEDRLREEAAERREAAREAQAEAEEAAAEARAARAEAESEANESGSVGGMLYNIFVDEPADLLRGARDLGAEALDEIGDAGAAAGDEIRDVGRELVDEGGDAIDAVQDFGGDALDFAYRHTVQYMHEYARYGRELADESGNFMELFGAIAAYHSDELAAFTFAHERPA